MATPRDVGRFTEMNRRISVVERATSECPSKHGDLLEHYATMKNTLLNLQRARRCERDELERALKGYEHRGAVIEDLSKQRDLQEQAAVAARAESAEHVKLLEEATAAQKALRKEVRKANKRLVRTSLQLEDANKLAEEQRSYIRQLEMSLQLAHGAPAEQASPLGPSTPSPLKRQSRETTTDSAPVAKRLRTGGTDSETFAGNNK